MADTVNADGVLWRIDMSSFDPEDWEAEALHDLYYGQAADAAEPTYYPPALTINPAGEIVILVGTGNIDVLDDASAVNRVVSITEKLTFDTFGFVDDLEGDAIGVDSLVPESIDGDRGASYLTGDEER